MKKKDFMVIVFAAALTVIGVLSSFMVAVLHAGEGDWGHMIILAVMIVFGYFVLRDPIKCLVKLLEAENEEAK